VIGQRGTGVGEFMLPSTLTLVPGLGLVVRDAGRVQVLTTPDNVAMASMSVHRVGWMVGVVRGTLRVRWRPTSRPPQAFTEPGPPHVDVRSHVHGSDGNTWAGGRVSGHLGSRRYRRYTRLQPHALVVPGSGACVVVVCCMLPLPSVCHQ
jgi:hypothetical protein